MRRRDIRCQMLSPSQSIWLWFSSPVRVNIVGAVGHQRTLARSNRESKYGAKIMLESRSDDLVSLRIREWTGLNNHDPNGGSLGRIVAVLAGRPRGIPNVIERVSWFVQFLSDVHQLAAQFGKEIAEPGCVPPKRAKLLTHPSQRDRRR